MVEPEIVAAEMEPRLARSNNGRLASGRKAARVDPKAAAVGGQAAMDTMQPAEAIRVRAVVHEACQKTPMHWHGRLFTSCWIGGDRCMLECQKACEVKSIVYTKDYAYSVVPSECTVFIFLQPKIKCSMESRNRINEGGDMKSRSS